MGVSYPQRSVLSKGLKFAILPRKIPIPHIVAAVENGLKGVEENTAVAIRHKVVCLLKTST